MRKLKNEELKRKTVESYKTASKNPLIIILDNIRSLNNIGSVFRTCDAFIIEKIYLCGITATPPHRNINKTALGATENVDWEYVDSTFELVKNLKKNGTSVWAIEQTEGSVSLEKFIPDQSTNHAFIFGNEVYGVNQKVVDLCKKSIEIPQFGTKHSLNISVAVGIIIWDFMNKKIF